MIPNVGADAGVTPFTNSEIPQEIGLHLMRNASDILTVIDAAGIIHYQSPSAWRLLGYHPLNTVGRNVRALLHPDDHDQVDALLYRAATIGLGPGEQEWRVRHHEGQWRLMAATAETFIDPAGRLRIVLNSRDLSPAVNAASIPEVDAAPGSAGTILLVEDEANLRDLIYEYLQYRGHHVLAGGDARVAMRLVESNRGPVDLLLTDIGLPGESGPELARRLRQQMPDLKVLLMSGSAEQDPFDPANDELKAEFIHKPFNFVDLNRRIRSLLGS